jgi:hypothetical protein
VDDWAVAASMVLITMPSLGGTWQVSPDGADTAGIGLCHRDRRAPETDTQRAERLHRVGLGIPGKGKEARRVERDTTRNAVGIVARG